MVRLYCTHVLSCPDYNTTRDETYALGLKMEKNLPNNSNTFNVGYAMWYGVYTVLKTLYGYIY